MKFDDGSIYKPAVPSKHGKCEECDLSIKQCSNLSHYDTITVWKKVEEDV